MDFIKLEELDVAGKKLLIRQDLNVPIQNGKVTSDKRIVASLPTIKMALEKGAQVMIMSHLGRPTEGKYDATFSLLPVANRLSELLQVKVDLVTNWLDTPIADDKQIVLCENVRFNLGEKANDDALAKKMAAICDIYVMDAFATAHRAQASTHGVAKYAKIACAGPLLVNELTALTQALAKPARPIVAIVGGAKVSTKLTILESLSKVVDKLIVGGGIANTFIAAQGYGIGKSLYEQDLIPTAKKLITNADVLIPCDAICGKEFSKETAAEEKTVAEIQADDMVFDIGKKSVEQLVSVIDKAATIIWNGPVGVFEFEQFSSGTKALSMAIANSKAFSIAGGGDTLAAIDKYNIENEISYISTGGGAFLEFLEGKKLPAVALLEQRAKGDTF